MTLSETLPTWAPRVKQRQICRLYEDDAQGLIDEELLDEVGWGLYARCKSFVSALEAFHGRAACPVCATVILHDKKPDELLHCPACGWEATWKAYHQSFQHKQLYGGKEVMALFQDFIDRFPKAKTPQEKMTRVDILIHGWHWNTIHKIETNIGTRSVGVNLIQGSLHEVVAFLDQLSYGAQSTAGGYERLEEWREKLGRSRNPRGGKDGFQEMDVS